MPSPPANAPLFLDSSAPESLRYRGRAEVAQLVEHSTENAGVAGSIPALGTRAARSRPSGSSSVVEHFLAKEEVAGSNPVSRSTAQRAAACRCRRRGVAQLVARVVRDDEVAGSSPVTPTTLPHLRPRAAARECAPTTQPSMRLPNPPQDDSSGSLRSTRPRSSRRDPGRIRTQTAYRGDHAGLLSLLSSSVSLITLPPSSCLM